MPKSFDLVSTGLSVGVLIPYFYDIVQGYRPYYVWGPWLMVCAIAGLLTVDRLEYWLYGEKPPARQAIVFLSIRVILIEVVSLVDHFKFSPFLYLIIPFLACLYFGEGVGYGLAGLVWIVYLVKHNLYGYKWWNDPIELHYLILFTLGLLFAITMARVVSRVQASHARTEQLLTELEMSHRQLKAYSEQVAELATISERNRLARDIHDTLGHYLTVINVQLEKAQAFRAKHSIIADQAVSDAKRLASEALRDVRDSVGALRTTQEMFSFGPAMTRLIERVRSDECMVDLCIDGNEDSFSRQQLMALYRSTQEGLTNVQRHAGATHVRVEVHFEEQQAGLLLSDNGSGFDPVVVYKKQDSERGYGLLGIQERLELVGGSLQVESKPGAGTRLRVIIPKDRSLQAHSLSMPEMV
jgi:signal transduction histidine kinase